MKIVFTKVDLFCKFYLLKVKEKISRIYKSTIEIPNNMNLGEK